MKIGSEVHWFDQQIEKTRVKRDFSYFEGPAGTGGPYFASAHHPYVSSYPNGFGDPLFKEQWYLTSGSKDGFDMNVQSAWKRGYTGKGVVVSILDDGIQTNHPDLALNYVRLSL
ncbi:unnamed protein product [Allacma fusca]|uniref:Peptidase S8/S53 domain-containing protein n=1 Tax=Allacma fusca TaxID=39272 RepID=A0A8J2J6G0_9HEXA|nr:unnamed protein product [Allacma fusca]